MSATPSHLPLHLPLHVPLHDRQLPPTGSERAQSASAPAPPAGAQAAAGSLGPQEIAALRVLMTSAGKVVSRRELARRLGIADRHERRCDSVLVGVRRVLGPHAITTVRSRGWMLDPGAAPLVQELLTRHD